MKKSDEDTSSDQSQAKIFAMEIEGWPVRQITVLCK
jgi:hypothetical protein